MRDLPGFTFDSTSMGQHSYSVTRGMAGQHRLLTLRRCSVVKPWSKLWPLLNPGNATGVMMIGFVLRETPGREPAMTDEQRSGVR